MRLLPPFTPFSFLFCSDLSKKSSASYRGIFLHPALPFLPLHLPCPGTSETPFFFMGFSQRFIWLNVAYSTFPFPHQYPQGGILLCAAPDNLPVPWHSPPWPERLPSAACWSPLPAGLPVCSAGHWVARYMWWGLRLARRCKLSQLQDTNRGWTNGCYHWAMT